jgi:hypothetical protein
MSTIMDHILLGGAERTRTRVRGFAPWTPRASTEQLLAQVDLVLAEYIDHLPLTLRQIFYRLVGAYAYEKTEQAYERLCEHLNRARRARLIPMDIIRDDGGTVITPHSCASAEEFLETVKYQAGQFRLDRTLGQKSRLVVICEAAGMAPQLGRVCDPFTIKVLSGGGFDSLTDKHKFAAALVAEGRPVVVLHIGDHDPSGVSMFLAFLEDVEAFTRDLGGDATFTRLAVTPEQIVAYGLPTAPPKAGDNRAFNGQTCQAEALAPDVLADILRRAIEERLDQRAYEKVLRQERKIRRELSQRLTV